MLTSTIEKTANMPAATEKKGFYVTLASNTSELRESQALRYQVFAEEMGATLKTHVPSYDEDDYDAYCYHLLVREQTTYRVIGCTRILTSDQVMHTGGFYAESEFDLGQILCLPGRFMEIGRTCVHKDYRNGHVINQLWSGLARFMVQHGYHYLMGCASIPLVDDYYDPLFEELQKRYATPADMRVKPRRHLRRDARGHTGIEQQAVVIPALLKAYLRLGAKICGEPYWDADFKVADLFILLTLDNLQNRYVRHFLSRAQAQKSMTLHEAAA